MFDEKNISKLFRFEALLQAIDFFTQKFNIQQISQYAFEFTNEILTLNASALFLLEGNNFVLKKTRQYGINYFTIPNTDKIQRIATLFGDIITSNFDHFFEPEDISVFRARLIIPLIIKDQVYGFIISDGKAMNGFNEDDYTMSRTLMRLFNNALSNSTNFAELQDANKELDQKIFNLFSINQSSKILLSELNLSRLYSLSIDIFSELTSSKITALGIYDDIRDRIVIRGYRNVFSNMNYCGEFELRDGQYSSYKIVFHYERDREELERIFVNYEEFKNLESEYIILIVKDKVLGFVTLSKPVNERPYDEALFELIESLSSSTYISLTNALLFKEVTRQKQIIEQKFNVLSKLNKLIKNINNCETIDDLCDLTIKTLHYGFGIRKACIALQGRNGYEIKNATGFTPKNKMLEVGSKWESVPASGMFYRFTNASNSDYFGQSLLEAVGDCNCLIISPLHTDNISIYEESRPLGYIVVFQTPESLKEEEVLLLDTISISIAPVISHMQALENTRSEYIANERELFIKGFNNKVYSKQKYAIDFWVYYKSIVKRPFEDADLTPYIRYESYYFDNMLFVLSEVPLEDETFDGKICTDSMEYLIEHIKDVTKR